MAHLRELRMLKEWLNSQESEIEWEDIVRPAASGIECWKCGTESGVLYFDFGNKSLFYCLDCVNRIKEEEIPPPGTTGKNLSLRFRVLMRDNFTCVYCGRNPVEDGVKLEVDHIIPKSRGGTDDIDNLVTACWECNQGKKDLISDSLIKYTKRKQG